MTQRISRPDLFLGLIIIFFFGVRENVLAAPQKTSGTRITVPSSKYLKIECY